VAGSGLSLKAGQPFAVHATGQVSFIQNGPLVRPNGASDLHPGVCVLPGATRHAGLIGRIGATAAGPAFFVGENFTGVADRAGELTPRSGRSSRSGCADRLPPA
jgi:hypothetical protein